MKINKEEFMLSLKNTLSGLGDIKIDRISGDKLKFDNSCGDVEGTIAGDESDYKKTVTKPRTVDKIKTGIKTLDVSKAAEILALYLLNKKEMIRCELTSKSQI